jgi:lipopolysaccharide/colanic/teichoic acid biosynthesis glycosyltransferase
MNFIKRLLDIFISIIALIILSPIFLICIIVLSFTGEGEVFYLQERLGFLNSKFFIIKFATMLKNSPNIGSGSITVRNDPRVLPFGRFLRKTKINELPQIINVLKGEMSIVGPRPQMVVDFEKFPENTRDEIYKSKPGITGIGSIVFRDEEKWISNHKGDKHVFYKEKIAPYKTELELWYLKNQSILIDLKLILITALVIVFPTIKPSHLN